MFNRKDKEPEKHTTPYNPGRQRVRVTNERSNAYGRTGSIVKDGGSWCSVKMDGDMFKLYRLSYSEVEIIG